MCLFAEHQAKLDSICKKEKDEEFIGSEGI